MGSKQKQYTLAAILSGKFESFFKNKPIPKPEGKEKEEPISQETIKKSKEARIVVVGDSDFVTNQFIRMNPENLLFLQNMVDWLTLGEDLISIRSREITIRPLKEISDRTKIYVKAFNIVFVPLILVTFGIIRFYIKRREKRLYTETFPLHKS
jgi:ABC-type uncharacterized transport system involved in gliding motility auxiliary subunit